MEIKRNLNPTIKMMKISRKMMRSRNLRLLKGIFQTKKRHCRKNNNKQSPSNLNNLNSLPIAKFQGKRVKMETGRSMKLVNAFDLVEDDDSTA